MNFASVKPRYSTRQTAEVMNRLTTNATAPDRGPRLRRCIDKIAFATEAAAVTASSLVFDEDARVAFERDVLFPIAGLPKERAVQHVKVGRVLARLSPAIGVALADYLSGTHDYIETVWALQTGALMAHPEATIQFANQYRGFALAYTWAPSSDTLAVGGQQVRCRQCQPFFSRFPSAHE
jgi:hypothetical protein